MNSKILCAALTLALASQAWAGPFTPEDVGSWIEANYETVDANDLHDYLVVNTAKIDWEKFNDWNDVNGSDSKYTDLLEGYEGWEDDEILPWKYVVDEIEDDTLSGKEVYWVIENRDRIDPAQFNEWREYVFWQSVQDGELSPAWINDVSILSALKGDEDWLMLEKIDFYVET